MALKYSTDDTYKIINNLIASVKKPTPKNMTLDPNYETPKALPDMTPKTSGPITIRTATGDLMEAPAGTPLSTIRRDATVPSPRKIEIPSAKEAMGLSTETTKSPVPEIAIRTLGSGDRVFDVWAKMHGVNRDDPKMYEKYIERASQAKVGSAILTGASGLLDAMSARNYRRDVERTKSQYETQKEIIDTNIANTEAALMENLQENMAALDVMSAAKNVDLKSGAVVGDKTKGAMDLGKDIVNMRTNGALQKAALNLEYKMNVARAKQAEKNSYAQAALTMGAATLSLL